ncbi:hypothetical protein ACOJQI_19560 [Bacillus salacetis]|uniref:hypothetical protein n=1 Tax=Bacillus salacetis TaxID=2315464 RepID=UPI003B9F2906
MYQTRILDQQELIDELIVQIAETVFRHHPELLETFGEKGRSQTRADLHKHFHYLQTAFRLQAPELFIDHVKWLYNVLSSRKIDTSFVLTGLSVMKESVMKLPSDRAEFYFECLSTAIDWMKEQRPS